MSIEFSDDPSANNGICLKMLHNWDVGDSFVIQPKGDWQDPIEIVIKSKERFGKNKDSGTFINVRFKIVGECGTEVVVRSPLSTPLCDTHEIFKNWQVFFTLKNTEYNVKKRKLIQLENFVTNYAKFEETFSEQFPERFI